MKIEIFNRPSRVFSFCLSPFFLNKELEQISCLSIKKYPPAHLFGKLRRSAESTSVLRRGFGLNTTRMLVRKCQTSNAAHSTGIISARANNSLHCITAHTFALRLQQALLAKKKVVKHRTGVKAKRDKVNCRINLRHAQFLSRRIHTTQIRRFLRD